MEIFYHDIIVAIEIYRDKYYHGNQHRRYQQKKSNKHKILPHPKGPMKR